ncbi:hypothetical protein CG709_19505 [Lachnotalea glycerini]|nr:hypothetical protein CG709_19505 [Lachnotalea glycerini]
MPPKEKLLPPNGVYRSKIIIDWKIYQGTTNIGYKPTVSNDKLRGVETFIFDLNKDLYGKMIEVDLYMYKRPEQKFESVEQLKMQMTKDIEYVKKYFNDSLL